VPKSTVSRRLRRLEAALGVKLLHRGPRKFTLTTEGNRLFDNVHASIEQVEGAIHAALEGGTMPRGHIRITAPEDFGRLLLLAELRSFAEMWPEITFEVNLSNRFVDLVQEGYDLAVRASPLDMVPGSQSMITRKLQTSKLHLAGSAASSKQISSLEDLRDEPFVLFRQPSLRQEFALTTTAGRQHRLAVAGRFVVHDYGSMATLVAQGVGYGLMPLMHIEHSGSALQCILPKFFADTGDLALVYPSRQLPRRVSLLIEHLSRKLGDTRPL
jgi:DNA-binding transcriptional LysR family regulator